MEAENASKQILSKRIDDLEEKFQTLELTTEEQEKEIESQREELSSVKKNMEAENASKQILSKRIADLEEKFQTLKLTTEEQKKEIESQREELSSVKKNMEADKQILTKRIDDLEEKFPIFFPHLLERPHHRELFNKDINVNVDSDGHECFISDMCQMSDGTVVVIDKANNKLKRLDDNFNVRDIYQSKLTPRYIVPVSSTKVAILSESWKIDLMTLGESIVHEKINLENKDESKFPFGFEYCNDRFWILDRKGIYIYSSSGSEIRYIENDLSSGIDEEHSSCSSLCTNKDKTRVYATNGRLVYVFDTEGESLSPIEITEPSYPLITTAGNDLIVPRGIGSFSLHICIYDMEGEILFVFFTYPNKKPRSLLYDEKKGCFIVAIDDGTIEVLSFNKQVK